MVTPLVSPGRDFDLPDCQRWMIHDGDDLPELARRLAESEGGLFLYADEHQRLFSCFGRPPVPPVPLVLDHNVRNTQQIAEVCKPLAPLRMRL